jgi:hypothetical protein
MANCQYFPYSRVTKDQIEAFKQKVGRPPTPGEELMRQLERAATVQFGEPWRVRMAAPPADPLDWQERESQ